VGGGRGHDHVDLVEDSLEDADGARALAVRLHVIDRFDVLGVGEEHARLKRLR